MIYTKWALIKAKAENSDRLVVRNISQFLRISKDAVFPNSTSDESDGDFEYSRHDINDNHDPNNRIYLLRNRQPPCQYGTAFWLAIQYTDVIFQEQDTFGLVSFTGDVVEGWSTCGRC